MILLVSPGACVQDDARRAIGRIFYRRKLKWSYRATPIDGTIGQVRSKKLWHAEIN